MLWRLAPMQGLHRQLALTNAIRERIAERPAGDQLSVGWRTASPTCMTSPPSSPRSPPA
jgi:hypothetical protein